MKCIGARARLEAVSKNRAPTPPSDEEILDMFRQIGVRGQIKMIEYEGELFFSISAEDFGNIPWQPPTSGPLGKLAGEPEDALGVRCSIGANLYFETASDKVLG